MSRMLVADTKILELAAAQHGIVSIKQLLAAGVSRKMTERRVSAGLLQRLHRGVYRVGPLAGRYSREMAAVLACGGKAVISHRSAAALWTIMPARKETEPVEVISPHGDHGRMRHLRATRIRRLYPDEVTTYENVVPITNVARTLMDLAAVIGGRDLERAVSESYAQRLTHQAAVVRLLDRHAGEPGVRRLLELVGAGKPTLTKSQAEQRFLEAVRSVALPLPQVNVRVRGYEVDFHWKDERLVVEVDGYAFHSAPDRFESDRQRDSALMAAGIRVMRVTWRQLMGEREKMLVRLAQALAVRPSS